MKTMEEKASEVTTRWQELHPGGGPTSLSVADVRAAKKSVESIRRTPFLDSFGRPPEPCPTCGGVDLHGKGCPDADPPRPKQVYRIPFESVDWEEWRKNMGSAINKTAILLEGVARGNRNPRLENLRAPVLWFEGIAVGERPEYEFQMWSVVPPQGCEITFFGEQAKDRAIKMAQLMLDDGKKK